MIPNIIHFVFGMAPDFGGRPFILFHYLAIKSAYEVNKPDKIYFVCAYEPTGEWFEKAKPYIEIVKIDPPKEIFGRPLKHYAHQADIIRLQRIIEFGGIYMDLDVICQKPLMPFLSSSHLILGKAYQYWHYQPQGKKRKLLYHTGIHRPKSKKILRGLCNAVIMAPAQDSFLIRWLESYKNFRAEGHDTYWDEHSVIIPDALAKVYFDELSIVEDNLFFYPSFDENSLRELYEKNLDFQDAYLFHLWESLSFEKYLVKLTVESIQKIDTTYNKLARKFLYKS